MGFGFNLFGFPILMIATVFLILYATRRPSAIKVLAFIWGVVILLIINATISDYLLKPIALTKKKIVGDYRIDTTFFNGKNARWQYHRYCITISNNDSLYIRVLDEKGSPTKVYPYKIKYAQRNPHLWTVVSDSTHHIIAENPTLYRGHSRFYYVFHSHRFGTMFFRHI